MAQVNDGVIDFILSTYGNKIKEVLKTTNLTLFFFADNETYLDKIDSYPGMITSREKDEFKITVLNDYSIIGDDDSKPIYDFNVCSVEDKTFIKIVTPFVFQRAYDFIIARTEEAEAIFKILKKRREDSEVETLPEDKIVGIDLQMIKREIVDFLLNEKFRKYCVEKGIKLKRGFIFGGKPGTGKTTTIKYLKKLAMENDIYFRRFDDPKDFMQNTGEFFGNKKSIFIFEDFEGFVQDRKEDGANMVLTKILNTLDGTEEIEDVVTIFTTNYPENFDSALLRPGRIDKMITFDLPTNEQKIEFLGNYIKEQEQYFDFILKNISTKVQDVSYALLKGICDDINIHIFNDIKMDESVIKSIVEEKMQSSNSGEKAKDVSAYVL